MRRNLTIAALLIGAISSVLLSWAAVHPRSAERTDSAPTAEVLTPRRAPEVLGVAADDTRLRSAISQAVPDSSNTCLVVSRDERLVLSRNPNKSMTPASTVKLLTATAALDVLGADTRFNTELKSENKPKNGVVDGSVYLVGVGDPLLYTNDYLETFKDRNNVHSSLESFADQLLADKVKTIKGGVVGVASLFDSQKGSPTWDPSYAQNGVVGPVGALVVNQGFTKFNPKTAASDPAEAAALALSDLLKARGIAVEGSSSKGTLPAKTNELASVSSPTVREIVAEMLTESDNTTAEILLKQIAAKEKTPATSTVGVNEVLENLKSRDLKTDSVVMKDGSGLDRGNRSTCEVLSEVLALNGHTGDVFNGLAKAGESGTLKDRMKSTPAVGRVRAKTGTLSDVSGFTGWATPAEGSPIAFAMISNGPGFETSRRLEDKLSIALATLPPPSSVSAYAPR